MNLEAVLLIVGSVGMGVAALALAICGDPGSALLAGAWSAWMAMMHHRFRK